MVAEEDSRPVDHGQPVSSVEVGGLELAYRRAGEGPPLVLLHGAPLDSRMWWPQLADLCDEFAVIAWDEPGAGRSSDPPEAFGLAEYADCLATVIDALGLGAAHVGGLSWGGVVAQELYRRHPERVDSLILADTYAGWKGSLSETECAQRLAGAMEHSSAPPEAFAPSLPGLFAPDAPAALVEELDAIMADARPESSRHTASALAACDCLDLLPRIDVPTLLVWGEVDARSPLSVAAQFRDRIRDARLVVIPDAGHMSNLEQPARFNSAVREFCRSVSS